MNRERRTVLLVVVLGLMVSSILSGCLAETVTINALAGNSLAATISLSGSDLSGYGKATMPKGHKADITIYVQHRSSGGVWSNVSSHTANKAISASISYKASSGEYRIKVQAKVYDSSGKYVETLTKYSSKVSK